MQRYIIKRRLGLFGNNNLQKLENKGPIALIIALDIAILTITETAIASLNIIDNGLYGTSKKLREG